MIAKLICRLFGHRKPYLFTPDEMRCVCSRCGFASDTIKVFMGAMDSGAIGRMIRESYRPLMEFKQFEEIKKLFTTE